MSTRAPDRPQSVAAAPSPQAARVGRARWLDPRLVVGVLLVLGSVVLGSVVVSRADDSVAVWALETDLGPGNVVTGDDLVERRIRLDDGIDAYLPADQPVPEGYALTRAVGAGELLPRAALGREDAAVLRYVSVAVDRAELPAGLDRGDAVEVWMAPAIQGQGHQEERAEPERLAERVVVASVAAQDEGFGAGAGTGAVPVVLAVQADRDGAELDETVAALLDASRARTLYLVGLPAGER